MRNLLKQYSLLVLMALAAIMIFTGCGQDIPPGYVGMVKTRDGLTGILEPPGYVTCWGRDKMVLIENAEKTYTETMDILCADDLNFSFDLKIRCRPKTTNGEDMKSILNRMGSNITWNGDTGVLQNIHFYNTYLQPVARASARAVVRQHETTAINKNSEAILGQISETIMSKQGDETPLEVTMIESSNYDYPDVITEAVMKKRQKEIQIQEEEASQAIKMLQEKNEQDIALLDADNRQKLAEKMKIVRAAEAEAEAVYNDLLTKSLTEEYLRLREIEAKVILYSRVSAGDKVIITGGEDSPVPMIAIPTK